MYAWSKRTVQLVETSGVEPRGNFVAAHIDKPGIYGVTGYQQYLFAKEVKAFAAKSEKTFARNIKGTVNSTAANAKEGISKLEHVFEARVAKTLNTFGIPSSQNVRELQVRMADLQKALNQLNKRGVRA